MKKKMLVALLLAGLMSVTAFGSACGDNGDDTDGDTTIDTSTDGTTSGTDSSSGSTTTDSSSSGGNTNTDSSSTDDGDTNASTFTVKFMSNGGSSVDDQTVSSGSTATESQPIKNGYVFNGWYASSDFSGSTFDFSTKINKNITLYAKWEAVDANITYFQANNESIAVEWSDGNVKNAKAYYKLSTETDYTPTDSSLLRMVGTSTARVDFVGLQGGKQYDIKICATDGNVIMQNNVAVQAYDRSGYAHFNYTDGVGAYNDDGSLKSGALVIYLTEDNKNDVKDYVYKNGVKEDITQYVTDSSGVQHWGIGEILNNRRYSGNDRMGVGIAKLCQVYSAVVIRVIGTVEAKLNSDNVTSTIKGLTDYDSTGNGGSEGDNGRMARMVNAKNVTIEGIGNDATIKGWGIHFIASDPENKYPGAGKSFEVRNLTFTEYPEDAVGMEGMQGTKYNSSTGEVSKGNASTAKLLSSVERCWVHNNTFESGLCENAAERDKKEGDGSCDFKRGQYFTCSYNKFNNCHKTNLVGANKDTLQFNLTYHHNYWYNCKARQPLARNANIHFYNNYIQYTSDTVISARANCYVYAESNYFEGCKKPTEVKNENGYGTVKSYSNTYYACYENNDAVVVSSRDYYVANDCKFTSEGIDYSHFDTSSTLFYYDAENKRSDCKLDTSVQARVNCILYSGVQKRDYKNINTEIINIAKPSKSLTVPTDGLTIDLSSVSSGSSEVSGVVFANISSASGGIVKGKGQFAAFTLASSADISIVATKSSEYSKCELLRADGTLICGDFEKFTGTLEAGTYVLSSGQISGDSKNTKEVTLNSLSFSQGATDEQKAKAIDDAINAIPTQVTLTDSCYNAIITAEELYNNSSASIKNLVTNVSKLEKAIADYSNLQVAEVKTKIEAIGNVNTNSGSAITAARNAYNALTSEQKENVDNYYKLTSAETAYLAIAVDAINNSILNLTESSSVDKNSKVAVENLLAQYEEIKAEYDNLDSAKQSQITGIDKVTSGISYLNSIINVYELKEAIASLPAKGDLTSSNKAQIISVKSMYTALTEAQKAFGLLTSDELAKYNDAIEYLNSIDGEGQYLSFTSDTEAYNNSFFTYDGSLRTNNSETVTIDDVTYKTSLKMESSTSIKFVTEEDMTLTLYFLEASGKVVTIDGVAYAIDDDGTLSVELSSGSHTITKGSKGTTNTYLFFIELIP